MRRSLVFLVWTVLLVTGCGPSQTKSTQVFAAISTQEALTRIATDFRRATGLPVECNFAASSDLARQIEHGASADLFLSADEPWADYLADRGLIAERCDLLRNRLVVVESTHSRLKLSSLGDLARPDVQRLAVAGAAVPAGRYAREALNKVGIWERVKDRVIDGGNVRATLAYVDRGEADAGLVYATDVHGAGNVRVVLEVPANLHAPIVYPLVLVRREPIATPARRFYDYLSSDAATAIFRQAGFEVARKKPG
jgi:molybdate transport system substrate-binding protein